MCQVIEIVTPTSLKQHWRNHTEDSCDWVADAKEMHIYRLINIRSLTAESCFPGQYTAHAVS